MTRAVPHAMTRVALVLAGAAAIGLATAASARALTAPVKEVLSSHIGWEVNATTKGSLCTVAPANQCQPGTPSSQPGGFQFPKRVAVNGDPASEQHGDLYVADAGNERVQVLTPAGAFVLMFGWDVNKTKVEKGASQAERNVCTAASTDTCQVGVAGAAAGQFGNQNGLAIDPATGDVYISDATRGESGGQPTSGQRVQKFTSTGGFVLEAGEEVNATTKANICTAEEVKNLKALCVGPKQHIASSPAPAAPDVFGSGVEAILAFGPDGLLYVGEEHRVQKLEPDGKYKGELSLSSLSSEPHATVTALAFGEAGDLYLVYENEGTALGVNVVRKFTPGGEEVNDGHFPLTLASRDASADGGTARIAAMAVDPAGRLALSEEESFTPRLVFFGGLYSGATGRLITEFPEAEGISITGLTSLVFLVTGQMFAVDGGNYELVGYEPQTVGELVALPSACVPGGEVDTSVTLNCTLNGEVNPFGVNGTKAFFEWGRTPQLGSKTPEQPIPTGEAFVPVSAPVEGLRPNEILYDRLGGFDAPVQPPEQLRSDTVVVKTPAVAPKVVGEQSVSFVKAFSAVMFGELNPENANTTYDFQYGPECEGAGGTAEICPGQTSRTSAAESAAYGRIGTTLEATGLRASTPYRYRLSAKSAGGSALGAEGTFMTAPALAPQAATGAANAVGATSATIAGVVNPNGQPATYSFKLGVYNGAATQYGVLFTGSAGSGAAPVEETLGLTGLQPGSTYAYRIAAKAGAGESVEGEPRIFTTQGLPSVLQVPSPLAVLAVPNIVFPTVEVAKKATPGCARGHVSNKRHKCVKVKKKVRRVKGRRSKKKG